MTPDSAPTSPSLSLFPPSIDTVYSPGRPILNSPVLIFKSFSATHLLTLIICLTVITAIILLARRLRPQSPSPNSLIIDPAGRLLGLLGLFLWCSMQLWWCAPSWFDPAKSLPLQICDLAGLIAAVALLTGSRFWTTMLYFWGLALSTQAFFTPVVKVGPLFTEYWIFWESHTLIIGSAAYTLAVRRYRPAFRDVLTAYSVTLAYLAIILPLDIALTWNYGYVGNARPDQPTLIDHLGPWPWRLFPLAAIVFLAFFLVYLPWPILAKSKSSPRRHLTAS